MGEDRRGQQHDRRARSRSGRRGGEALKKPWYMRRRVWLATASLFYMGWRRLRKVARRDSTELAA